MARTDTAALIVLASDGIFDVFDDFEACAMLRAELSRGVTPHKACEALCAEAADRGSYDDKTVVLVCLGDGTDAGAHHLRSVA